MSRETDSSSAGPQGRGGAAYPSGTPPYGSRQYPSLHPTQDAPDDPAGAAPERQAEEPRTETTLTTRIRINIPGSRPIPPVVMRTPMSDTDAGTRPPASGGPSGGAPAPGGSESERTGSVPRPAAHAEDDGRTGAPAAEEKPAACARPPNCSPSTGCWARGPGASTTP
ncbi:hypothetical protein ACWD6S_19540, partial [Streptomyces zhihengii]